MYRINIITEAPTRSMLVENIEMDFIPSRGMILNYSTNYNRLYVTEVCYNFLNNTFNIYVKEE